MIDQSKYYRPPMTTTPRVTSRRAKTEGSKVIRQTLIYLVLTIILVLGFIFVIMPGFFKLINRGNDLPQISGDTIPPQVPMITTPSEATFSAQIKLEGYGEPKSKVKVVVNGNESAETTVGDDGNFASDIDLTDGENVITLYAIDEAGNESAISRSYPVTLDKEAPSIEITTPTEGQTFEQKRNQVVEISGKTEVGAKVLVNDRLGRVSADGTFKVTFQLAEGENKIKIRIEDKAGNLTEKELTVNFKL